jgi:hypothetical protein
MRGWIGLICHIQLIIIILGSGLGWLYVGKICATVGEVA